MPVERLRRLLRGLTIWGMCCAPTAVLAALDLPELMALLGQHRSGQARYTEQRFVSGLDQTLNSSGRLSFSAPDRLSRRTDGPRSESLLVEGNRLTLERAGRSRQMTLDSVPEMAAVVAAIRGTLTGDGAVLAQYFRPAVDGTSAQWTLTLLPLDQRLNAIVRHLRMEGQQADLRKVEVQLADGDRSLMLIEPLVAEGQGTRTP